MQNTQTSQKCNNKTKSKTAKPKTWKQNQKYNSKFKNTKAKPKRLKNIHNCGYGIQQQNQKDDSETNEFGKQQQNQKDDSETKNIVNSEIQQQKHLPSPR